MKLSAAAKVFRVHVSTVRRWVCQGCPTTKLGQVGRGCGTEIDVEDVERWLVERAVPTLRSQEKHDTLQIISTALFDCLKRDDLANRVKISEGQAAMAVLLIFERAYRNVHQSPLTIEKLPAELRHLRSIVLSSVEQGHFHPKRR